MAKVIIDDIKEAGKKRKATYLKKIPEYCIYETINGKPVYYQGFEKVIKKQKTIEEIMGSSYLQSLIIATLVKFINMQIDEKRFMVLINELGIHLKKGDNLSLDIAIYEKEKLQSYKPDNKYIEIAPKVVFEIDTKADLSEFDSAMDYIIIKTNKLFNAGVEKVIWIISNNKKTIVAKPGENWIITDWNREIEIFENLKFTLDDLLDKDGIYDSKL